MRICGCSFFFFFSSRRRHTIWNCDWSSDVCSSDLSACPDFRKVPGAAQESFPSNPGSGYRSSPVARWFERTVAGIERGPADPGFPVFRSADRGTHPRPATASWWSLLGWASLHPIRLQLTPRGNWDSRTIPYLKCKPDAIPRPFASHGRKVNESLLEPTWEIKHKVETRRSQADLIGPVKAKPFPFVPPGSSLREGILIERLEELEPNKVHVTGGLLPAYARLDGRSLRRHGSRGGGRRRGNGQMHRVLGAQQAGARHDCTDRTNVQCFRQVQEFCTSYVHAADEHWNLQAYTWRTTPLDGAQALALPVQILSATLNALVLSV